MAAGLGQGSRESMDAYWGNILKTLTQTLNSIQANYQALLNIDATTGLTSLPSIAATPNPYSAGDRTALLNAAGDANNFNKLWLGTAYLPFGASANAAVVTAVDGTHFGYAFQSLNIAKLVGAST